MNMSVNETCPDMKRKFSPIELERFSTLHILLQEIVIEANRIIPIFIIEGHRGEAAQNKAFDTGKSKVKWPNGKHNTTPSKAVDIGPIVNGNIPWNNMQQFAYMNGIIRGIAFSMGVKIRQGIDFNMNGVVTDDKFNDAVHIELMD
jgi:peptidoglycan L-alanyl-D-glutamate endopeptidase CwlK